MDMKHFEMLARMWNNGNSYTYSFGKSISGIVTLKDNFEFDVS